MAELTILVPTRNRPHRIRPILNAWYETGAFDQGAELVFVTDADDENHLQYVEEIRRDARYLNGISHVVASAWRPLVPKLNKAALIHQQLEAPAIGFMGDDHLPRTPDWAARVIRELKDAPRVVSSPDGYRPDDLPTWWAMSSDIIRELGAMVPVANLDHLYCDNAVRDLASSAGIYSYLPGVLVEHMHPIAGKADMDEGYERVNSPERYARDRRAYAVWAYDRLDRQAAQLRRLKGATRGV